MIITIEAMIAMTTVITTADRTGETEHAQNNTSHNTFYSDY